MFYGYYKLLTLQLLEPLSFKIISSLFSINELFLSFLIVTHHVFIVIKDFLFNSWILLFNLFDLWHDYSIVQKFPSFEVCWMVRERDYCLLNLKNVLLQVIWPFIKGNL